MRQNRVGTFAVVALAFLICIPMAPSFARRFLGEFTGAELRVDTQIESPAQNNNAQNLPEKNAGETIQFQLFVPAGGARTTNGFTVELDLPGKTFSSYIGNASGWDWSGANLISKGNALSALFLSGATVPATGYLGQVKLEVSRMLEDGATLIVKGASMTSGNEVDQLDVSNAVISFAAASDCPGDFDNSGSVDLSDFLVFAGAFGTSFSDANYDARADLDGSRSVDLADFLRFAGVFGTDCPTDTEPPPNGNGVITREQFDTRRLATAGYLQIRPTINDFSRVVGGAERFDAKGVSVTPYDNREYERAAGLLLSQVKGCAFAAEMSDLGGTAYIQVQRLSGSVELPSQNVCGARTAGGVSIQTARISRVMFFDESSATNMREAVYNESSGQYDLSEARALPPYVKGSLYFAERAWRDHPVKRIRRMNLEGFGVEDLIDNDPRLHSPGDFGKGSIGLDMRAGKMYWIGSEIVGRDPIRILEKIQRADLDGSNIEDLIVRNESLYALALDLDAGKMYYGRNERIYRANLDGSGEEVFAFEHVYSNLEVFEGHLYYAESGSGGGPVKRIKVDGSGSEILRQHDRDGYGLIAIDKINRKLYALGSYWAEDGYFISRMNLDGTKYEDRIHVLFLDWGSRGLIVDGENRKIYWTTGHGHGHIVVSDLDFSTAQIIYRARSLYDASAMALDVR